MLTREEDVAREIIHFFKTLFSYDDPVLRGFARVEWEGITNLLSSWLERPFSDDEVKSAVFECDGNKAPGPNGFSMAVFQSQWDTVKNDIMKAFEEFHKSGVINGITNETYICLIPKKLNSSQVKDFRPISLVAFMYKIIAKVLARRCKRSLVRQFLNLKGLSWLAEKFWMWSSLQMKQLKTIEDAKKKVW